MSKMQERDPDESDERGSTIPHWYHPDGDRMSIVDGDGADVYDDDGNAYLDFVSQLYCVNAGHSEDRIVDAMTEQLQRIPYVSSSKRNDTRERVGDRLAELAPGRCSELFFSVSGSEANELAVQLAREYADAPTVLTRYRSYHGSTSGAGSLSGDPSTRTKTQAHAATTGSAKFFPPMAYPSPFDADSPEELAEQAADHLEFVIKNEGPESIAAILTEPVAGTSGAYPAPPGYFERVRELCDEYDILLISDEVITGFGRCGEWFGIETEGVEPDMITFAKGVTSAYAPLAGVVARPEITEYVHEDGFDLGQTFAGHPAACAAADAALDVYEDGLIDNVREHADGFEAKLRELGDAHDVVADVRGRGYLWGVEFADPETGEPFHDPRVDEGDNPVDELVAEVRDRGVLIGSGRPATQVILSPPLLVDENDMDRAVTALDEAIEAVFE